MTKQVGVAGEITTEALRGKRFDRQIDLWLSSLR